ncbi:DUF6928 family protein [Streptomyces blastmyceticus]|uniref:Gfo/Idh/MocA-like oxidoreductase C-terminal domain-containing protein n=1 Tax=Streptomyces blastmyceticus TaxID=68180 RepID=A0ABP3HR01_9ACTN
MAVWPPIATGCVGRFPGVDVITSGDLLRERPSELSANIARSAHPRAYAVFMDSSVDRLGFALWENGTLVRSLSLSPGTGIIENIGEPLPLEKDFWAGRHPLAHAPDCPLPFHPADLGNEVLRVFFGFVREGPTDAGCFDPEVVTLAALRLPDHTARSAQLQAAARRMIRIS